MANGNGNKTIRLPGLAFGVALSDTSILFLTIAALGAGLLGMHTLKGVKQDNERKKMRKLHSPGFIENSIFNDVVSYATNVNSVGQNWNAVKNQVKTLRSDIRELIQRHRRGEISTEEYTNEINALYQRVMQETNIPTSGNQEDIKNKFSAKIERIKDRMEQGTVPTNYHGRMYKSHPYLWLYYRHALRSYYSDNQNANHNYLLS